MTARRTPLSLAVASAVALAGALNACEPLPAPYPRIVEALPSGTVSSAALRIAFTASEPLDRDEVLARVGLCRAEDLRDVKRLAEAGTIADAVVIPARVEVVNGGRTIVIAPHEPLVPGAAYAAIFGHGARAADGRLVLDGEGRPRSVVAEFDVSPVLTGPIRAELTRVLADAETPEAGGEYVEVTNLASEPLDLAGFRLAKRGPTGAFTRCVVERRSGVAIPAGGRGLVAGGAYDGRYGTPAQVPVYACGNGAVAGGLANDRPPALLLEDPTGSTVSSFGIAGPSPLCEAAVVRIDPRAADGPANLACDDELAPASAASPAPSAPTGRIAR